MSASAPEGRAPDTPWDRSTPCIIVGAGAIGTWLAASLARGGGPDAVWLLARPEAAQAIAERENKLVVEQVAGATAEVSLGAGRVTAELGLLPTVGAIVFLATRAYQTEAAVAALAGVALRPAAVVSLQNGLGNAEKIAAAFPDVPIVAGATSHGVTYLGAGLVRHAGMGDTAVAAWHGEEGAARHPDADVMAARVADLLSRSGIETAHTDDAADLLWRKVVVNAAINPLTALYEVPNGELLDGDVRERRLEQLAREAAGVARAESIALADEEAVESAKRVARRTAANRSSMLQAVLAGRVPELEAITGQVVSRGKRLGVPVAENEAVLEALRAKLAD